MELFLFATGLALGISFICSLLEAAVLSLSSAQIANMDQRSPVAAAIWRGFKLAIDKPIAVILVLNTTAHTIGATIAGAEFARVFGPEKLLLFSVLFTVAMLQFTEVLPKSLGVRYNGALAPLIARPLAIMMRLLSPLLAVIHWINKPFQGRASTADDLGKATLEELAATARLAHSTRQIGAREHRIITGVAQLRQQTVEAAMVPRSALMTISSAMSPRAALAHVRNDPHSVLLLTENGDLDRVIGQVSFEDLVFLFQDHPENGDLRTIAKEAHQVNSSHLLGDLLDYFGESGDAMALVVTDGRTVGMVTLTDVLDELIGEMETGDHDLPRTCIAQRGSLIVGGSFRASDLATRLSVTWRDAGESTIDAWLRVRLGDLIHIGRIWSEGDVRFRIRRLRHGRIAEVEVIPALNKERPLDAQA